MTKEEEVGGQTGGVEETAGALSRSIRGLHTATTNSVSAHYCGIKIRLGSGVVKVRPQVEQRQSFTPLPTFLPLVRPFHHPTLSILSPSLFVLPLNFPFHSLVCPPPAILFSIHPYQHIFTFLFLSFLFHSLIFSKSCPFHHSETPPLSLFSHDIIP